MYYVALAEYHTADWSLRGYYDQVGGNFNREVGFVRYAGYRQATRRIERFVRFPEVDWLREVRAHIHFQTTLDLEGFKKEEFSHLHANRELGSETVAGDQLDGGRVQPAVPREAERRS